MSATLYNNCFRSAELYPASRGFFLATLLACKNSFASLVFYVVGLPLTSPIKTSLLHEILETRTSSSMLKELPERNLASKVADLRGRGKDFSGTF